MLDILSQNLYDFITPDFLINFIMIENVCHKLGPILLDTLLITHDKLECSLVNMLSHFDAKISPVLRSMVMVGLLAANELS